jgi:hypothetical protein
MIMRINPYVGISRMRRYRMVDMCKDKRKYDYEAPMTSSLSDCTWLEKSKSFISQQRDILPCTLLLFFSFTWFIPRDDWMIASQSATTLYIYKMGRSCPCWSWRPNKSRAKIQLQLSLQSLDPVKPPGHPGLTGLCDVQIFQKSYLSHPDSELDVLYMDLDLLDETYPMGMSKLPFKDFG